MQKTSPSAVPLPVSPNASQSDFEALIDLLATDEPVGEDPFKSEVSHPQRTLDLRDEGGRLDFTKIKALFSSNGINLRDSAPLSGEGDKGGDEGAQRAHDGPPQLPGSPLRTSAVSTPVPSQAPINIVNPPSFESGLPLDVAESTPLATIRPLERDNLDLIDLSSDQPPWASESTGAFPSGVPTPFHVSPPLSEEPPVSLTTSLALAQKEVAMLRNRVRELEELINKSRDQLSPQEHDREPESGGTFRSSKAPSSSENNRQGLHEDSRIWRDAGELETPTHDQAQDLNSLSLTQTRIALKSLLDDLGLPPSCISSLLEGRKIKAAPISLDEIHRAVDLVIFLDELVWRRSRMGAVYDNPYGEENVRALRDRFELWERTVRTRR